MTLSLEREEVILVDENDRPLGIAPKLAAHRNGQLHRAVSVQLRDWQGRLLLQKRHIGKYHSGGLWTNTCCGHPRSGETAIGAAQRRLTEEMGIACPLSPLFSTRYRADLDHGMIEHEVVHVFGGRYEGEVRPNPTEADDFAWLTLQELTSDIARAPNSYSIWFRIYIRDHEAALTSEPRRGESHDL
jgi:isopentenyl-diphosphate delta-isomerase